VTDFGEISTFLYKLTCPAIKIIFRLTAFITTTTCKVGIRGLVYTHVNKSPLPLTEPRDAVPNAYLVVHRCRRSV